MIDSSAMAGAAPAAPTRAEIAAILARHRATALARLHSPPRPPPKERPPLVDHSRSGPIAGTLAIIERQVPALEADGMAAATRGTLLAELAWARGLAADTAVADQPIALVG